MTQYVNNQEKLKGRHEEIHIKVFSTLHKLPGEEIRRRETGQKPDFLYRAGELITGIEHTELKRTKSTHGKHSLAELKGIHRKIVERAKLLATKQGIPPIEVEVWFNDYFYRYPNKGEKTVQALLNSITVNIDKILTTEYSNSIEVEVPEPFVGISKIYARAKVHGNVWLKAHRWKVIEPARVMRTFLSELQDAINAKNKKIDEYLKNCDECWLLIVADRSKADQSYYLTPEIEKYRVTSKFHRTFFLEIMESFLVELTMI